MSENDIWNSWARTGGSVAPAVQPNIDPNHNHTEEDPRVFVFGSNLQGIHAAGAAWYAHKKLGAVMGVANGPTGRTYAIPTCSKPGIPLSLPQLKHWVDEFIAYAWTVKADESATVAGDGFTLPSDFTRFFVSAIGCGIAGFKEEEVAPLFADAPDNCDLPTGWRNAVAVHG